MIEITRCKHGIDLCQQQCQLCDPIGAIGNPSPPQLNITGMQAEIERLSAENEVKDIQIRCLGEEFDRLSSENGRLKTLVASYCGPDTAMECDKPLVQECIKWFRTSASTRHNHKKAMEFGKKHGYKTEFDQ